MICATTFILSLLGEQGSQRGDHFWYMATEQVQRHAGHHTESMVVLQYSHASRFGDLRRKPDVRVDWDGNEARGPLQRPGS